MCNGFNGFFEILNCFLIGKGLKLIKEWLDMKFMDILTPFYNFFNFISSNEFLMKFISF